MQKLTLASVSSLAAIAAILIGAEPSLAQRQGTCDHDLKRVSCQIDTQDGVRIASSFRGWNQPYDSRSDSRSNNSDRSDSRSDSGDNYEALDQIYRDVLGRDIDRRGYRVYSARIRDGWSLSKVRKEVARSSEATQAINRLYQKILGRDADPAGMRTYQKNLEAGWSLRQVERALANSQEGRNRRRK